MVDCVVSQRQAHAAPACSISPAARRPQVPQTDETGNLHVARRRSERIYTCESVLRKT